MAVKNVTFEVTANTQDAQKSLNALIKSLDDIQAKATIKVSVDTSAIKTARKLRKRL